MAYKPLWDTMDELEGKKRGSSFKELQKELGLQGYKRVCIKCGINPAMPNWKLCRKCYYKEHKKDRLQAIRGEF